ncbi:MAG: lipopolysaccharide biosynthesis protein [Puniceicoccaceae bacterium]
MISKIRAELVSLVRSNFLKSVALVAGGTAISQLIGISATPVITRLYGPEAFGVVGSFLAFVTMLKPVISMSYPIAIVLPPEEAEARDLVRLSVAIAFSTCVVVLLVLIAFGDAIRPLLALESISSLILLVPAVLLVMEVVQSSQYWLIRHKLFKTVAMVNVLNAVFQNGGKIILGLFWATGAGLIWATFAGVLAQALVMIRSIRKSGTWQSPEPGTKTIEVSRLVDLAGEYKDFPLYRCPQIFINSISQSLPVLMLAGFFGPASAGFYTLARQIVAAPVRLIGTSVSEVFYPRIVDAVNSGESPKQLLVKATAMMALVGLFPFGIIILFGPYIFSLVFGSEWYHAGVYARWISLWMYFGFLNRPSVATIPSLGLQRGLLIYEVFSTGSKILALGLGFLYFKDDVISVAIFCVFGSIAYLSLIIWVIANSGRQDLLNRINDERTNQDSP